MVHAFKFDFLLFDKYTFSQFLDFVKLDAQRVHTDAANFLRSALGPSTSRYFIWRRLLIVRHSIGDRLGMLVTG